MYIYGVDICYCCGLEFSGYNLNVVKIWEDIGELF